MKVTIISFNWLTDHRILERNHELKSENLSLSVENEKLRLGQGIGDSAAQARIQALEKRLLDKQEELTEMHKRKSDNQQLIIDFNVQVTELQKQLEVKNNRWVTILMTAFIAVVTVIGWWYLTSKSYSSFIFFSFTNSQSCWAN